MVFVWLRREEKMLSRIKALTTFLQRIIKINGKKTC